MKHGHWSANTFIAFTCEWNAHLVLLPTKCLAIMSIRSSSKNIFRRGLSSFSFGDGGFGSSTIVFAYFYCKFFCRTEWLCDSCHCQLTYKMATDKVTAQRQNLSTVGRNASRRMLWRMANEIFQIRNKLNSFQWHLQFNWILIVWESSEDPKYGSNVGQCVLLFTKWTNCYRFTLCVREKQCIQGHCRVHSGHTQCRLWNDN